MKNKFNKLIHIVRRHHVVLIEAGLTSLWMQILLRGAYFNHLYSLHQNESVEIFMSDKIKKKVIQIKRVTNLIERFAPWKPKCYNIGLTAKRMLQRRDINAYLQIGFMKNEDQLKGHAWLTLNEIIITGYLPDLSQYNSIHGRDILQKVKWE